MPSLNSFETLRRRGIALRCLWIAGRQGISVAPSARLSFAARFVSGGRGSISVGEQTVVALLALVISRTPEGDVRPVRIGSNSFVGAGSVILPGVTIGDGAIVAAGSIVFDDVASGAIVGGSPARLLQEGVVIGRYGRLPYAWDNDETYWRPEDLPPFPLVKAGIFLVCICVAIVFVVVTLIGTDSFF